MLLRHVNVAHFSNDMEYEKKTVAPPCEWTINQHSLQQTSSYNLQEIVNILIN